MLVLKWRKLLNGGVLSRRADCTFIKVRSAWSRFTPVHAKKEIIFFIHVLCGL